MEFRAQKNKRINNKSLVEINKAKSVDLKWRYQKNLDNGQVISYVKDSEYKKRCLVKPPREYIKEQSDFQLKIIIILLFILKERKKRRKPIT